MKCIFQDCLDELLVIYMVDLLILSKDEESRHQHLQTVLLQLKEHELYVSPMKCDFIQESTDFLGLTFGKDGIHVNHSNVKILKTWPKPDLVTDLRSFLCRLKFFQRFITSFAKIATRIAVRTKKGSGMRKWNRECDISFQNLKHYITYATVPVASYWKNTF